MTKFGDELGVVEIDLFIVIADALKHGITPKEIDAAYRSACSQALNKSRAGRPKGSPGKGKKIEHNLERMREALVADPDKLVFTSAREVSECVPARERFTPQHLATAFKKNKKLMRRLEILRALKKLRQMLENRPDYEEELAEIENRVRKLCFGVSLASGGVKKNL